MSETKEQKKREVALRTIPMPADTNGAGDIFGGWVMSQMDLAGSVAAVKVVKGRIVTVAVNAMRFHAPVHVGDLVSCYTHIVRVGTTSVTIHVEVHVLRNVDEDELLVTEADFTFVALGPDGRPTPINTSSLPPETTS